MCVFPPIHSHRNTPKPNHPNKQNTTPAAALPPAPSPAKPVMYMHTSGTTSRPKRVRLTHGNLASSLANIQVGRWVWCYIYICVCIHLYLYIHSCHTPPQHHTNIYIVYLYFSHTHIHTK